ncbi:MAG: 50S ribosomal protein L9 [Candidatus Acetothermia bacterium]|nr:50S ribosomal protein L9 [Candidatus Acetothermia bacterium]MDH7505604.1 50S ribosomal protein L9 [Candidatus Acetothermia bacterium]
MKVLLIQRVEKLGDVGDVVSVADGYARNFLFPRGLAVEPTEHNLRQYEKFKRAREEERRSREEKAKELKQRLEGLVLKFVREAHGEQLYGSVRREEIAERIKEELGAEIEKGRIALAQPLDKVGVYPVKIELYGDISVEIQVEVAAEEASAGADEQG